MIQQQQLHNKRSLSSMIKTTRRTTVVVICILFLLLFTNNVQEVNGSSSIGFEPEDAKPRGNIKDLKFISRITVPYGPNQYPNEGEIKQDDMDQPYKGYGVGTGACEQVKYDKYNHYLYSMSDMGYIIIIDYQNPKQPKITNYSFPTGSKKMGSIAICSKEGILFIALEEGIVDMYNLVNRFNPTTPKRIKRIQSGANGKSLLPNKQCTMLVVSNTNEGKDFTQGSITFLQNILVGKGTDYIIKTTIPMDFNSWDDEYLLRRGLNMPLTKNAIEYWDDHSYLADQLDFSQIRDGNNNNQKYHSSIFLGPEQLSWNGPDETEVLVNMQQNNGLLRINVTDFTPVAVAGYGLKDYAAVPVDINKNDKDCQMRQYNSLFAMRMPDSIKTIQYGNKYYVLTANEGDDQKYNGWEEAIKGNELFNGKEFKMKNTYVTKKIFDPNNITIGHAALFNDQCSFGIHECVPDVKLSLGSNSIDYESDPKHPIFYRMVLFGGRGWSIYELPENPEDLLKLVFDSADAMEKTGCEQYPWSHNGRQDEYNGPIGTNVANNTFWQTIQDDPDDLEEMISIHDPEQDGCYDQGNGLPGACPLQGSVDSRSHKTGPGIENVIVGVACGRLVAAVSAEDTSITMLFDITEINSPELIKVFHLTPISEYKSMGLAYNDGELGDVDPESGVFLSEKESPNPGNAAIMFAGALSGTVSYWEFQCYDYTPPSTTTKTSTKNDKDSSSTSKEESSSSSSSSSLWTRGTSSNAIITMIIVIIESILLCIW